MSPGDDAVASGYPDSSSAARAYLVLSHVLLLLPIRDAWRVRDELPELLVSLASCLAASTTYHACYSYDACVFEERRIHRHLDHIFSGAMPLVLLTTFLWRGGPLRWYRPLFVDGGVVALHALLALVHVAHGMDEFGTPRVIAGAIVVIGAAYVTMVAGAAAAATGLVLDGRAAAASLGPLLPAYFLYRFDAALGAWGHGGWHTLGMVATWGYLRYGPVLRPGPSDQQGADAAAHGTFLYLARK